MENQKSALFSVNANILREMRLGTKMKVIAETPSEEAVLLTDQNSYRMKKCEHTNTFCLTQVEQHTLCNPEEEEGNAS